MVAVTPLRDDLDKARIHQLVEVPSRRGGRDASKSGQGARRQSTSPQQGIQHGAPSRIPDQGGDRSDVNVGDTCGRHLEILSQRWFGRQQTIAVVASTA